MRIEKKLKNEAEYTDKKILETGENLKAALMAEYCTQTTNAAAVKPIYKRKPAIISMCCIIVCLLVIGICLPIVLNDQPKHYAKENEVSYETTLNEICNAIGLQINENNFTVSLTKRTDDCLSGDKLFYWIEVESDLIFPYGSVHFVVNQNYSLFDKKFELNCTWKESNVSYELQLKDLDNLPAVQVTGCLEYEQLRIYFAYTDIDTGVPTTPINFLDSLLIV